MRSLPVRLGRGRSPLPHAAKPYPAVGGSLYRQYERKTEYWRKSMTVIRSFAPILLL